MTNNVAKMTNQTFEDIRQIDADGNEFWYARALAKILDYAKYRNFLPVIEKAKIACERSGCKVMDHFVQVHEMIQLGKSAARQVDSYVLSRYACYLIVQNADSSKPVIANIQTYFAIQTRRQELKKQQKTLGCMNSVELAANLFCATQAEDKLRRNKIQDKKEASQTYYETLRKVRETIQELGGVMPKELSIAENIYQRGVDNKGFERIRSKGDSALFGGNNTSQMKDKLSVLEGRALADFLPTVTLTAKNLATEITNHNVRQNSLNGENNITEEHVQNNSSVRNILIERGIKPENLPASEDIKNLSAKKNLVIKKKSNNNV
jgi:DNA-damage-inducible protein D